MAGVELAAPFLAADPAPGMTLLSCSWYPPSPFVVTLDPSLQLSLTFKNPLFLLNIQYERVIIKVTLPEMQHAFIPSPPSSRHRLSSVSAQCPRPLPTARGPRPHSAS